MCSFDNCIVVKFCWESYPSQQQTDGMSTYSRHLSSSERGRMAGLLNNNSVSKIFNKQFTNFSFGNFSYLNHMIV